MRRVRATYSTVAKLVSSHDVVLLQETHGSDADLASLRLRFIRHLVFGSFTVGHHGGGVVFIVDPAFAELYSGNAVCRIRMVDIIPGRLAKIIFPNTLKMASLEVVNIHLEVEVAAGEPGFLGARCGFVAALARALTPRTEAHTIIGGDFNCCASDEPRFNPVESSFTNDRSTVAKLTEVALEQYTELYQPHYTRRGTSGGVIVNLSRIDRLYSNCATCDLMDRRPLVATIGIVTVTTSPSDHVPVSGTINEPIDAPPMHPKIATWIVQHRFFPAAVAQLWRTARLVPGSPMERLAVAKEVLHGAAILTKSRASKVGAETVPERLHWALLAFRGLRSGRPGWPLARKAAAAYPHLCQWLPEGPEFENTHLLGDLVASLAADSLNTEILEMISAGGPPGDKGNAKLSKLHALAATWRAQRRRLALSTIVDENGQPQSDTERAAELLVKHWAPVFRERNVQGEDAFTVMQHTPAIPGDIEWKLDRMQFGELVARPRDGAPGPDGLPYAAWRMAGAGLIDVLYEAYEAFLKGSPLPPGFNDCLMVFIPKGDEAGDRGTVARTPAATRPISLSNTASKFFALAVNYPLAQIAQFTVHRGRGGLLRGGPSPTISSRSRATANHTPSLTLRTQEFCSST
jgi:endonuclease/exonuclease/phosphatase family metal-dependent hydrolase